MLWGGRRTVLPAPQPSLPESPRVSYLPTPSPLKLAWPSTRLWAAPALSPDVCYLHTHLWTNGQLAGSWSPPPEGGPPLRPVSDSLGWSPRWGGVSQWRRPSLVPPHGTFYPRTTLLRHPTPCTGTQARQQDVPPALHSCGFTAGFPIEQMGQLRLRQGM